MAKEIKPLYKNVEAVLLQHREDITTCTWDGEYREEVEIYE